MNISSNVKRDLEVKPYYNISNFSVNVEGDNIVLRADVTLNPAMKEVAPNVIFARGFISTSSEVNRSNSLYKVKTSNYNKYR